MLINDVVEWRIDLEPSENGPHRRSEVIARQAGHVGFSDGKHELLGSRSAPGGEILEPASTRSLDHAIGIE
jgi:hypothetical protein